MLARPPTFAITRFGRTIFGIAIVAKVVFLLVFAWNTRFVMDEYWHMSQPNYLFNGFFDTILPEKAVGYAVFFKLAHFIGQTSTEIMLTGRLLSAALALGLVATVYGCARHLRLSPPEAALGVLLLLCFSNFMERSFELRSEPLAILLAALALLVVTRGTADSARHLFLAGVLCGLSFVTTQKSVYFNVALGTGLVLDALLSRQPTAGFRRGIVLILGWMAAVAIYAAVFGGLHPGPVLRALFLGPLEVASTAQVYYENLGGFVVQTFTRNAPLYLLGLLGLAATLVSLRKSASPMRIHATFTTIITVLVFLHNQPWPYVFTMALPFLAPYIVMGLKFLNARMSSPLVVPIVLIGIMAVSFQRNVVFLGQSNLDQLTMMREAESLLPPQGTYFDGTGMLPARKMEPYIWLDAMNTAKALREGPSAAFAQALFNAPPDMVILSYRTDALLPILGPFLAAQYERVSVDLMVRSASAPPGTVSPDLKTRRDLFENIYGF